MNTTKYQLNTMNLNPLVEFEQPEDFCVKTFKNFHYHRAYPLLNKYCKSIINCMMDICDRQYKFYFIDVKVHNLKPNQHTANGLWHLDSSLNPIDCYDNFLFVSGQYALTEFFCNSLIIPHQNSSKSFNDFIEEVPNKDIKRLQSCTITRYNGSNVHRGPISTGHEKRLLIRLVNTDKRLPSYILGNK